MNDKPMTEGEALTLVKILMRLPEEAEVKKFVIAAHLHDETGRCDGVTKVISIMDATETAALLMSGMLTIAMRGGLQDDETDPGAGPFPFGYGNPFPW